MNRREMLTTTGAATLAALCMPKLMQAEAPASQVAIVRCRDYAQYGQQLSSAFDQIGGLDKLVRGKDRWTQAQSHRESEELAADA
jgi:hypothetical protein